MSQPENILAPRMRKVVERMFPGQGERAVLLGEGWDFYALLVVGHVVRLPKNSEAQGYLERELQVLSMLHGRLGVRIPKYVKVVREPDVYPWTFAAYPVVEGQSLDRVDWAVLSETSRNTIASQLSRALNAIHRTPLGSITVAMAANDWRERMPAQIRHFREYNFASSGGIGKRELSDALGCMEAMLADEEARRFEPCLTHGDMRPDHVLLLPAFAGVSGLIDFGDVGLSDPDADWARFYVYGGRDMVERMMNARPHPSPQAFYVKARGFSVRTQLAMATRDPNRERRAGHLALLVQLLERWRTE